MSKIETAAVNYANARLEVLALKTKKHKCKCEWADSETIPCYADGPQQDEICEQCANRIAITKQIEEKQKIATSFWNRYKRLRKGGDA